MLLFFALALTMAEPPQISHPAIEVKKEQRLCRMVEITGSRARRQVCRVATGKPDLRPGMYDSVDTMGFLRQRPVGHSGDPDLTSGPRRR